MLLLSPLSYVLGVVGSYNFMVLASFMISGLGMYLLARYFTQNVWGLLWLEYCSIFALTISIFWPLVRLT